METLVPSLFAGVPREPHQLIVGAAGLGVWWSGMAHVCDALMRDVPVLILDFGRNHRKLCQAAGGRSVTLLPAGPAKTELYGTAPLWLFELEELQLSPEAVSPSLGMDWDAIERELTPALIVLSDAPWIYSLSPVLLQHVTCLVDQGARVVATGDCASAMDPWRRLPGRSVLVEHSYA